MKLRVNPTRMELLKLRKRLVVAVRGHKLLKDKLDGLMTEFLILIKEYKAARMQLDEELSSVMRLFVLASITSSSQTILTALEQSKGQQEIDIKQRRLVTVLVPKFEVSTIQGGTTYSYLDTPGELDIAVNELKEYFPKILKLAELEQSLRLMAKEIEKTRRRVNALEYILIPQIKETIKFIKSKLDEMERSNINRLMKIKEMLRDK
ncbi:MAG: V-type ATP synthase subunit D [Candidatus Brocadiales bacterium]